MENAIETELAHSRYRLDDYRRKLDDALGFIVSRSPELLQLWQRMKRTWRDLRSLRIAFLEISRATQLDGWFLERAQGDEPLFAAVGYDVDEALIRDWVEGIALLRGDDTAPLPGAGRN